MDTSPAFLVLFFWFYFISFRRPNERATVGNVRQANGQSANMNKINNTKLVNVKQATNKTSRQLRFGLTRDTKL